MLALEREILGTKVLARAEFRNALQTNLYAVSEAKLDLLAREGFYLGVSLDGVAGVRLDGRGEETECRVVDNLSRVLDKKIPVVAFVVLAGHTAPRLREIHDFYADLGLEFRLIPLFDAPLVTPTAPFALTNDDMVAALSDLFTHWMAAGCRIRVEPLWRYLLMVLRHLSGLERPTLDRRQLGETVLTVNTDGELYETHERYVPGQSLGNVFEQPIDEILASAAYRASLDRETALLARHCGRCRYRGACDGHPVLSAPHRWPEGPCPIASRVCEFIEARLRADGVTESMLRRELRDTSMATATLAG